MKSTTLVAMLIAHFGASHAQGDCSPPCKRLQNGGAACNGIRTPDPTWTWCKCEDLIRSNDNTLYVHKTNTKVEILHDNTLHMWCHNSGCYRYEFCRIRIGYAAGSGGGDFILPGYQQCCTLPAGYIEDAKMHIIGT